MRDVAWAPNIGLPRSYIATASQVRSHLTRCIIFRPTTVRRTKRYSFGLKTLRTHHGPKQRSILRLWPVRLPVSSRTLFGACRGASRETFWRLVVEMAKLRSGRKGSRVAGNVSVSLPVRPPNFMNGKASVYLRCSCFKRPQLLLSVFSNTPYL